MGAKAMNFHRDVVARIGYEGEVDKIQRLAAVPDQLVRDISLVGSPAQIRDDLAA
jgi:hypothetical protein